MRTRLFAALMLLATLGASSVSCKKEIPVELSVSQTELSFGQNGGTQKINFTTNTEWTASSSDTWCQLSRAKGSGGTVSIDVTLPKNTAYDIKTATVTLKAGEISKTVSVKQDALNGLDVTPTEATLERKAQTFTVTVKANVEFTVSIEDSGKNWIAYSGTKALAESKAEFSISENTGEDKREAKITISEKGGKLASVVKVKQKGLYEKDALSGEGTAESPYEVFLPEHMPLIRTYCRQAASDDAAPTYFILMDDIDMNILNNAGKVWTPVNNQSPYALKIDFNGNGKTISNFYCNSSEYASLFGVLFGEVYDLKVKDALVESSSSAGILASNTSYSTGGTGNRRTSVENVHVSGKVSCTNTDSDGIGGMFGIICNTQISRCSACVDVHADKGQVGGLVGTIESGICTIKDCYTQGKVFCATNSQRCAGIVGCIKPKDCTVQDCISLSQITTNLCAGGIVGHANLNSSSAGQNPNTTVTGCIAWNRIIRVLKTKTNQYSSGAVVGFNAISNTLENCWRRPDMRLSINANLADPNYPLDFITLCDQPDFNASSPMKSGEHGIDADFSSRYATPYHGKAAKEGQTASEIAIELGWSKAWDVSGSIPIPYDSGIIPDDGGDNEYVIPGDDIPNHDPVTPEGKANWTRTAVDDGLTYWEFKGTDPVSGSDQFVHVTEVDLNKGYALKFVYDSNQDIPSNIMKKHNALVSMNGGLGASQIFIKVDGVIHKAITQDKNKETGVPNWRNDGAICTNPQGRVFVANAILSKDGLPDYGANVARQREFYKETLIDIPNIISGSALLIDGYNPLGTVYIPQGVDYRDYKSDSEHPFWHQGTRHPRTAIGITGDNRLIMLVVNGRLTGCSGFSAKEMTNFLKENFDPKYALNLDGGGSSCMCVKDCGDPDTHVVNWPCDNGKRDHAGERTVQTFLYIVKK